MKSFNLFQFNGWPGLPDTLQRTMVDVFEFCNSGVRSFFAKVALHVAEQTELTGCPNVVELGAGNAPLAREMLSNLKPKDPLNFLICDLSPNVEYFERLEDEYPDQLKAIKKPVDFSATDNWDKNSLLVLCAAFHHVPVKKRTAILEQLVDSSKCVIIAAPIRKTLWCMFCAIGILVPAILTPFVYIRRPGRIRRFVWCLLIPVIPVMLLWDGIGGCLRQWSKKDWESAAAEIQLNRPMQIRETSNSQIVIC